MIGICRSCDQTKPLFPDGHCDDCHYELEREQADLEDDYEDDDRAIENVPTGELL